MDKLKKVAAVIGVAFGAIALYYILVGNVFTLKNFGLSVESQLIAQRIITPLLFVALAALAVSCEYFRRIRSASLPAGAKTGTLVRILRLAAVVVLSVVIFIFAMKTPFWSFPSPAAWDRPQFNYGWFLPWKGERALSRFHMTCPFFNLFLWTLYLMVLVGYRRIKHYIIFLVVMLGLFVLYAKLVGFETNNLERSKSSSYALLWGHSPQGFTLCRANRLGGQGSMRFP